MLRFGATRVLASMSHALFTAARHGCGHKGERVHEDYGETAVVQVAAEDD